MKNRISKNFHVPLNSLSSVKKAKSSLPRGHMGGGGGATWSGDPGPTPWVRGFVHKKKVLQDPDPNTHTAAAIRKEVLTPPPQNGVPRCGGVQGSKSKKSLGDQFWS